MTSPLLDAAVVDPARPDPGAPMGGVTRRYRGRRRPRSSAAMLGAGALIAVVLVGAALLTLVVGHFDSADGDISKRLGGFGTPGHLLGTDQLGRDLFARALAGFRWSASVAGLAAVIVLSVGTTIGVLAGAATGVVRVLLVRLIDITLSLPGLVIATAILAVLGRGYWPLVFTLSVVGWALVARVVYAETLGLMNREFILAANLLGLSHMRVLTRHVLPNLINTVLVMFAFVFADLIVAESSLSFLGLGTSLGRPSLGTMLADGRAYLAQSPPMVLVPGVVIALMVVAANMIGDGIAGRTGAVTRELSS